MCSGAAKPLCPPRGPVPRSEDPTKPNKQNKNQPSENKQRLFRACYIQGESQSPSLASGRDSKAVRGVGRLPGWCSDEYTGQGKRHRDVGSIPGSGRCPGGGDGNQHSCLENPTDRGAWRARVPGLVQSWTQRAAQREREGSPVEKRRRCRNWRLLKWQPVHLAGGQTRLPLLGPEPEVRAKIRHAISYLPNPGHLGLTASEVIAWHLGWLPKTRSDVRQSGYRLSSWAGSCR